MLSYEIKKRNISHDLLFDGINCDWKALRKEMVDLLAHHVYGITPAAPQSVSSILLKEDKDAFAGKATHRHVLLEFDTPKGRFSFPINTLTPNISTKVPMNIFISFHTYKESYETPIEEIIDSGHSLAVFDYQTVTKDNDDMNSKLAGMFPDNNTKNTWGKIGIWAYALSRVMDYVQTLDYIDKSRIACVGHSRLGKTALWCAAQDTRFGAVFANDSGCSGAAVARGKKGEKIKDICTKYSFWFCKNYEQHIDNEDSMPFDQHYLLAAIAPRLCYICSAEDDEWADPKSEYLSALLADKAYKKLGLSGFVGEDRYPKAGDIFHEGEIGYHMRRGKHFLSRYDWQMFIKFIKRHANETI